ncbi:hypothetical protein [Bacillus alkalicellulosilyticus]|uniref:hypothetical protein n=1 Tax=Alkalihalobacterium alkalicellulosilyticum TaxID=1912214 RepID=UPI000996A88E|nr:hypothetical protein [Bacillus alkalicellulosilyticus]
MNKFILVMLAVLLSVGVAGCNDSVTSNDETDIVITSISLKDDSGNILATEQDLVVGEAEVTFEEGIRNRAVELVFADPTLLEEITTEHVNESIHFYAGDELLASPLVSQVITTGTVTIDGGFSVELAESIVAFVNSGE